MKDTIQDFVSREVHYCVSYLVHELASAFGVIEKHGLNELMEKAFELSIPVEKGGGFDVYEYEVFEHWLVTDWFGRKLEAHGEKVEFDLAGMTVWARTTTGQAIYMDMVVKDIYNELHKETNEGSPP